MASDPHGGFWLAIKGSVALYRDGKFTVFALAPAGTTYGITAISLDGHGWLIGSGEIGLVGFRNGETQTLTERNGLPCRVMYEAAWDLNGSLWVGSECGLLQISREALDKWWLHPETQIPVRTLDSLDGAQMSDPPFRPSVSRSPDGKLWFANQGVVQMVDPSHLNTNSLPPPVHIEEMIADRKNYQPSANLDLPALTRDVEIDYTALSFVSTKKVRFRYKLEGHDTEWQDPGSRRQAFYTDLKPAHYRFHVIASNNDGLWNQVGDTLNFSVAPALYQTVWFRVLLFLMAAGTLWLFFLARLNKATTQIQERLGARMEERERIARELHDTLLQGFQGLMLRFQAIKELLPPNERAHQMMEQVLDRADEILLEGRQSVRDLREEGAIRTELSEVLGRCGEELQQGRSSIFSLVVVGESLPLQSVVFDESYRVAREALINAFQHSHATKIEVEITYSGYGLSVRIRDDGVGIDGAILIKGRAGHWGLSGMRERAQKLGAQINIWSHNGAGTEIELRVPAHIAFLNRVDLTLLQRISRMFGRDGGGPT